MLFRSLAEIADDYADDYLQCQGEFHADWHTVRDNKFAKLIIQECVDAHYEDYQLDIISDVINKHFGIE